MIEQSVLGKQWVDIQSDWFGQLSRNQAKFHIQQDFEHLVFTVEVEGIPYLHPDFHSGFCEGLWEYDAAEWFVFNPETGLYIEFNLSPEGAWWMQVFDAPRKRMKKQDYDLTGVRACGHIADNGWTAKLSIPGQLLKSVLGEGEWKHNVCFILGQDVRQYLSWTSLNSEQPDYHRPNEFVHVIRVD